MRNLSLVATANTTLQNANVQAIAIDLDKNDLYTASEKLNPDGEVEVELWRMSVMSPNGSVQESPSILVSTIPSLASSFAPSTAQVTSLRLISEVRRLCVIMRGGDIVMASVDDDYSMPEVEGTVESGIQAAAWSPDETLLALVTGERKLVVMTSTFDVVSEVSLDVEEFGEDAPINVGWGSKQTQFHGSIGKTAAQAPSASKFGASPDDDGLPRVSWRGDGAFFVVSSLSHESPSVLRRRTLRVYDRQAILQTTSEPIAGLEHPLVWRPSGNLIVSTQRFGFEGGGAGQRIRHDVVFFERNGLRHGEFGIRSNELDIQPKTTKNPHTREWGYKVRELAWNSDSSILAVWIEKDDDDIIQLWTTGNYHWYLKHEASASLLIGATASRFTSMNWHPELPSHLILTTPLEVIQRAYMWETFTSHSTLPNDTGAVAVLDGSKVLLTPFRTQNVPPPMSSHQLSLLPQTVSHSIPQTRTPVYVAFSDRDSLAVLWETGYLELWALDTRLGPGNEKVMNPSKTLSCFASEDLNVRWRQVVLRSSISDSSVILAILGNRNGEDVIAHVKIINCDKTWEKIGKLEAYNCRLLECTVVTAYQSTSGQLFTYDKDQDCTIPFSRFPEFCASSQGITAFPLEEPMFIGHGKSGKLYATTLNKDPITLAHNATSFTIASGFIIFTTSAHESIYAPIKSVITLFDTSHDDLDNIPEGWQSRKVERGSRIVVAVPRSMSLVLQMPRGNLETINPRPLVLEIVKQDLDAGNYRKAFFDCRKHRIDLNFLVNHNESRFLEDVSSFVEQIQEVDHLNLFLTLIGHGAQSSGTTNKVCDALRLVLEDKDLLKYVNTILTSHVMKTPPDHEAGLELLLRIRDTNPTVVEDAVKYIIFLVDADSLFNTALGMYDFSLVLMIAQHAQKDPREYLPFLRELRALDKFYQRFKIDDHLKRYESALRNLSLAGPERFEEAVAYIEKNMLYEAALLIWKETDLYHSVLDIFGDWLFERREFRQAAAVFVEANKSRKALVAYERALEWQQLFDLAIRNDVQPDDMIAMGYRVAEDLSSKKRYLEAGRVLLDYSEDVREAVIAFVQGNDFSEARRIASLDRQMQLLEDVIYPAAFESRSQISEDIHEMKTQLHKQLDRIRELRIKKVEEPDAFYGTEDPALQNVDVMTDVSMPDTAFTRYTVAPTAASRSSKRSSRSKRKQELKVGSGRKGTVDEEEYLLRSVTKLVERFKTCQDEARNLLPHLAQFTKQHREEGLELQQAIDSLSLQMKEALEEVWVKPPEDVDSYASRMEALEKRKQINATEIIPKPILSSSTDWRIKLFDLK